VLLNNIYYKMAFNKTRLRELKETATIIHAAAKNI